MELEGGGRIDELLRAVEYRVGLVRLALETDGDLRWRLGLVARRVDAHRGNLAGLEINLDVDQCRVLNLGLHVIKVSPKPIPNIRQASSRPCAPSQHLDSSHFLCRKRFPPTAPPSFPGRWSTTPVLATKTAHLRAVLLINKPSVGLEPTAASLPWRLSAPATSSRKRA